MGGPPRHSRLDDVIARHEARKRPQASTLVWISFAVLLIVSTLLLLFTDLGKPKRAPVERVDGVQLRRAP